MKIQGVNTGNVATKNKESKKTGDGSFSLHLGEAGAAEATQASSAVSEVAQVNSLFALQEVDSNESPKQKAVQRGQSMVEYLDEIRISLLSGAISPTLLSNLDGLVAQWRESTDDPDLEALIDEIELRAAVEIAKLEVV